MSSLAVEQEVVPMKDARPPERRPMSSEQRERWLDRLENEYADTEPETYQDEQARKYDEERGRYKGQLR